VINPNGSTVGVSTSRQVLWEEVCELLLGAVFSCVLAQRGLTCLHAGVVQIGRSAIGFVGAKGSGKSTLVLALVQRGAILVSDDVALLGELNNRPAVTVGSPRLRVGRDSAEVLCGSYDSLQPMWVFEEGRPAKRYVEVPSARAGTQVKLDALYLLDPFGQGVAQPSSRRLRAVEAIPRLMAYRHMVEVMEHQNDRRDFAVLGWTAASVGIYALVRADGLRGVTSTADALLADLSVRA
jgi:hypothetical protein